jgi:hypothetical protein
MAFTLVGLNGPLAGNRYDVGDTPITFGRRADSVVLLSSALASRAHAELRRTDAGYVIHDLGSSNGTRVNGALIKAHTLAPGDEIAIGEEIFRFEIAEMESIILMPSAPSPTLRVTISGGGPVGLTLALLLEHLLGPRVAITIYDGRWMRHGDRVVWKGSEQGNTRRQQVVTIQSRQYLNLPPEVQERLFTPGNYTEMWPAGPDSVQGQGPRNIRIAHIEDQLLALAAEKPQRITLLPAQFDPESAREELVGRHILAICEGGRSRTREQFAAQFGAADKSMYSLDGDHLYDIVLGLRVKSNLPDPMAVLLTVAQNRFLLNSLAGEGFLNMRLTADEVHEAVGIDPVRRTFEDCVQGRPCLMERTATGEYRCGTHQTYFLPALLRGSPLWQRVLEGLRMFSVPEQHLSAVTSFRLDMVQRPRFTAQLYPATPTTPGTFGCLLGDSANAIHFWPGRGLNSGLASAVSLARCLAGQWRGLGLRDADFVRHEAMMAMLQYRHKSRAWRAMVTTDAAGETRAVKELIAQGIAEGDQGAFDKETDLRTLLRRMRRIRRRLEPRLQGLPSEAILRAHLERLSGATLHTLAMSGAWDTINVGGEEVDVEWLFASPDGPLSPEPALRVATPDASLQRELAGPAHP